MEVKDQVQTQSETKERAIATAIQEQLRINNLTDKVEKVIENNAHSPRFTNRGKNAIIFNILNAANPKGISKTHLMYQANLSHRMLEEYVSYLVGCELLEIVTSKTHTERRLFRTAQKGLRFLDTYNSLVGLCGGLAKFKAFSENDFQGEE